MALSTIDRVREAEKAADSKQLEAEQTALRIEEESKRKADELIAEAKKKAEDFDRAACDEAQKLARETVEARRAEALGKADALTEKTLKLKQNVINKLIIETLV